MEFFRQLLTDGQVERRTILQSTGYSDSICDPCISFHDKLGHVDGFYLPTDECISGCSFGEFSLFTDKPYTARFSSFVRPNAPWLTLPNLFPPRWYPRHIHGNNSRFIGHGNLLWCHNVTIALSAVCCSSVSSPVISFVWLNAWVFLSMSTKRVFRCSKPFPLLFSQPKALLLNKLRLTKLQVVRHWHNSATNHLTY